MTHSVGNLINILAVPRDQQKSGNISVERGLTRFDQCEETVLCIGKVSTTSVLAHYERHRYTHSCCFLGSSVRNGTSNTTKPAYDAFGRSSYRLHIRVSNTTPYRSYSSSADIGLNLPTSHWLAVGFDGVAESDARERIKSHFGRGCRGTSGGVDVKLGLAG